jgi:hypothetical protein
MSRTAALLIAACSLALSACQPAARASGTQRATAPAPMEDAPQAWPTSLVLGIGERVPLAGGTLKLERIAADSRCPKDAQCIWAGEVTLTFAYTPPAGAARAFQLSQRGAPKHSLGDHDVELTAFGPCPAGHTPASPAGCASLAFTPSQLR